MAIITITSDLGWDSGDLAKLKGIILSDSPKSQIIDVSHEHVDYDINRLFQKLQNIAEYYPKGSIHLIYAVVYYSYDSQYLMASYRDQFFIAPDNGLLGLLLDEEAKIYHIAKYSEIDIWIGELFARTAAKIAEGFRPKELGKIMENPVTKVKKAPVIEEHAIRATVIHEDFYGNLILNVSFELFEHVRGNRDFAIYYRRHDPITKISEHYAEVKVGEPLARFDRNQNLEIAVNMGKGSEILDLYENDIVQIQFLQT